MVFFKKDNQIIYVHISARNKANNEWMKDTLFYVVAIKLYSIIHGDLLLRLVLPFLLDFIHKCFSIKIMYSRKMTTEFY